MSAEQREELARMLAAAGLPASEEDVETQLRSVFPVMRAAVELLHAVPAAGEEIPAVFFDPDPDPQGWREAPADTSEER